MNRNKFEKLYKFYPGSSLGKNRVATRNKLKRTGTDEIAPCVDKYRKRRRLITNEYEKYCPKKEVFHPPHKGPPKIDIDQSPGEIIYPPMAGPPQVDVSTNIEIVYPPLDGPPNIADLETQYPPMGGPPQVDVSTNVEIVYPPLAGPPNIVEDLEA